jgi:(1->4)-alpha-D-glucan 1-alpha-D-glucosylmutase
MGTIMTSSSAPVRIPVATYRLQFNRSFTFADACLVVPYLDSLGITDCYASSYLKAVPGSSHGYDITDPTQLNPEIGTDEDYRRFVEELRRRSMGQILDVVPNHMGIGKSSNPWWQDVLENGPSSPYSTFFDIDWHPVKSELEDKVLLPILSDQYGAVLENQEITLEYGEGRFLVRYYDHRLPIAPKTSVQVLTHRLEEFLERGGADDPHVQELLSIITALRHLPGRKERDPRLVAELYREKEIARRRLAAVVDESKAVRAFIEENVAAFNGTKGDPASFDLLDALLRDQVYRVAHWRVAAEEINYRRFFDIHELAAIRMEDPAVFRTVHRFIFRLLVERAVTGLRIDHVDGLYDPGTYLRQLQSWGRDELRGDGHLDRPLFIIVEKILDKNESLPAAWPIHGTTGYEFLNLVNGLFVDSAKERAFEDLYVQFIRRKISYEDLVYESKKLIMRVAMASEINVLGHELNRLSERDRRSRDFTLNSLTHAITEIIACFPIYRTYVTEGPEEVTDRDQAFVRLAVAKAKRRNPALSGLVFDFVKDLLLKRADGGLPRDRVERLRFAMKFQQITGPVMAKGVEDTAFYHYNRLLSLNEVGGDPTRFGISVQEFHEVIHERRAAWPFSLSATATHDTKRGEDLRARLNVLSEMPAAWKTRLARWSRLNKRHKIEVEGWPAPDRNEEYLLYQTLVGSWPLEPMSDEQFRTYHDRIQAYAAKALKEAKANTSWSNPNEAYEQAVHDFIARILDRSASNPFLDDFLPFQESIARYGLCNSLAQVVLKIAAPGVPDFYQGTEVWDFSLVDPDNRRPVDYAGRATLLAELEREAKQTDDRRRPVRDLLQHPADGKIKLYITMTALRYRRGQASLFLNGEYVPMKIFGDQSEHLCAFARIFEDRAVVAVVPRLVAGLGSEPGQFPLGKKVWGETTVTVPSWKPDSPYRNLFTGAILATTGSEENQVLPVTDVLNDCPVALLERMT